MMMEIGAATAGQLTATRVPDPNATTNKAQAAFDKLTQTKTKNELSEQNAQQRLALAEHSGKGLNIDITA